MQNGGSGALPLPPAAREILTKSLNGGEGLCFLICAVRKQHSRALNTYSAQLLVNIPPPPRRWTVSLQVYRRAPGIQTGEAAGFIERRIWAGLGPSPTPDTPTYLAQHCSVPQDLWLKGFSLELLSQPLGKAQAELPSQPRASGPHTPLEIDGLHKSLWGS